MPPTRNLTPIGLCALALLTGSCAEQNGAPEVEPSLSLDEFANKLDHSVPALIDEFRVPGAAVALIRDGQPRWQRGYGHADLAQGERVTSQTGFNIGSISKTVAAWGVMKLVEEGSLELDAPVETYLTRWHLPDSEFDGDGVTVRRLLSHTAGLSLHGYPGWNPDEPLPSVEESLSGKTNGSGDVRLIMQPGTEWKYSGGGYTLAQLLVEEVTGESFAAYLDRAVVTPLGMSRSSYELTPEILSGSSLAHDMWGEPTPGPRFMAQAAAGFHTTIEDLARFAAAALDGADGGRPGRNVLPPETVALMLTPAPASNGRYGLGYDVVSLPDGRTANGHGGANTGWHAMLRVVPDSGDGIVVLTNGSNGWAVRQQIVCDWIEWLAGERPADGCKKPIGLALIGTIADEGVDAAIDRYRALRGGAADTYDFSEFRLNALGYGLLQKSRIDDAIEIFKLNVEFFPDAFNPYDSLGEAYMLAGDKQLARINYEKSLELNPENTNAVEMLEKLGQD